MATQASVPNKSPATQSTADSGFLDVKNFVIWLYAAILLLHLPTLLIYLRSLWDQPHYQQFFPFAILAAGIFIYVRLRSFDGIVFRNSKPLPNVLLAVAVVPIVVGNLIFDVNIIAFGLLLVLASFLGRICDKKSLQTLMPAALILLPAIRPPSNLDIKAITYLQQFTTVVASKILDIQGVLHNVEGNTILMPDGGRFFIEEACSGVQSLFTLIFCGMAFAVFERRSWIHTILLLIAAAFWAAFANTFRVFSICIAHTLNVNLAEGIAHTILGYFCLALGIGLLFSTDSLLNGFLGRRQLDDEEGASFFTRMVRTVFPDFRRTTQTREASTSSSKLSKVWIGLACAIILAFGLTPFVRLGVGKLVTSIFEQRYNVRELRLGLMDDEVKLGDEVSPTAWKISGVELKKREQNSDWGTYSNLWVANSASFRSVTLSCDYPFFAFHELSGCYRGNGWKIENRIVQRDVEQPYVEVEMSRNGVERGYLIFSLIDKYGEPVPVETADINRSNIVQRAINSFMRRFARNYGPGTQSYQFQVFHVGNRKLTEEQVEELRQLFLHGRDEVTEEIKSKAA